MAKRNWKRVRATSVREAIELCLDYARERHNRSVERVADMMGLAGKWTLYKWLESGRMPATMIRPFECACCATFLTDYIGASAQKLVINIPAGRRGDQIDVAELQRSFSYAIQRLAEFYEGRRDSEDTMAALKEAMAGAAWHHDNVANHDAPELALFEEAE